jgi:hypothetical protein
MFGWLKKKGQDSRVYMCIKEVKWELESGAPTKRAKILAIASVSGKEFFDSGDIPISVVDRPLDYSREDLMRFYEVLEDIRNNNTLQISHTKKMMRKFGMEFPTFAEEHAKLTGRSLEVWMATVGAGIAIDRRDDVREIWNLLTQSKPSLDEAMDEIVETENKTMEMTGQEEGMFSGYDREEWKMACNFLPAQFSKELNIG